MRRRAGANIFLIGSMASGKSSVGPALARLLGWDFVDTDQEIEREAGRPIRAIFRRDGEAAFRRMERKAVALAARGGPRVISVGGGAVLHPKTRDELRRNGKVVYLQLSAREALRRVRAQGIAKRPLFHGLDSREHLRFFKRLMARRRAFYAACADVRVRSAAGTPRAVAERIARRLGLS